MEPVRGNVASILWGRRGLNKQANMGLGLKLTSSARPLGRARIERNMKPLRIAALVKQVPKFEEMQLGPDGRLKREGIELFMNPYCLRAVSKGVELAQKTGGSCTVISLGPPAAEDVIRWGVAAGADRAF